MRIDEKHDVSNIVFDNVNYFVNVIDEGSDVVKKNEYVKHIQFIKK